ncbi:hypothetical protein FBU31_004528 [Coemansia sp. 'formosensis']|nr:hypothetical protein FBU31_004528 [Coemansia sp. 'formosensis']
MLSSEPYSGCPFPLVELLTLRFASGTPRTDLDIDAAVIVSNIDAFMSRLLQMAPLVSELVLEGSYLSRNYSATAKPQLTNLVTRLYQQYKRIMNHIHYNAEFTGPQLRAIHGLVRFDYTAYTGYSQAFQLARQSALTLQSLGITFGKAVDISGLFRDADDGYIEYTRLQALSLRLTPGLQSTYSKRSKSQWDASGDIGKLPTFTDATPFPVLLRLCLDIEYPFGDDTLFRGNRATLEYLELQLYPVTSGIIDKHRLFTLSSHPKLQCVLTREAYKPKSRKSGTTDFRYLNFLVKIGPRAQVRRILDIPQCSLLPPYDTSSEDFVHVRVLSLPGLRVEFPEVVMIFGSLPSLSDLCTMCPSFDSIPEGVRRDELWAYLVANKYMASEKQFKTWVFSDSQEYTRAHIVSCLRMVAMVCSVLDCISSQAGNCDILEGDMDEILVLQGFKQHAERMWRVISK